MLPLKANMVGYKGHISARIEQKGTGYDNKALHKITKPHFTPKKSLIPFSFNSLKPNTMNRVMNYRLGNNPITLDTQLAKLI